MLGTKFVKFNPSTYVLVFKNGKIIKEGAGLSFFFFAPKISMASVPISSDEAHFVFDETTNDFQEITIQGVITYKISNPKKISQIMNFTIDNKDFTYISDDPDKINDRIIDIVRVIVKSELKDLDLKTGLASSERIVNRINSDISKSKEIDMLGIEILSVSILSIKPTPETSRALEAEAREAILKEADEAIFLRRNSAVEQERIIRENELNTEIAVENKNREIRETKMEAEKSVQIKKQELKENELNFQVEIEEKNKELTRLKVENAKLYADSKAYEYSKIFESFSKVKPELLQILALNGMTPDKIIANAFTDIANNADKIGELNISSELLSELLNKQK